VDVQGAGVVVTGAARGIGRAIAERMCAKGARVVVNDVDEAAVTRVANELGALALPGDAARAEDVARLVTTARDHLGKVDVYFANAGIDVGHGLDASAEDWARALEVNVLAHVRAAQQLVPAWLETGCPWTPCRRLAIIA